MFDTNLLILLGSISAAAIFGVVVYELFLRRWIKRFMRKRQRHEGHRRPSSRL
jgi:uncharacterized protein (DUF2062 family)